MSGITGSKGGVSLLNTEKTLPKMVLPTDISTNIVLKLRWSKFGLSNSDLCEMIPHFNLHFHDNRWYMYAFCPTCHDAQIINVNMN